VNVFLRNYWYVAATADELDRKLLARWILGDPVVMYRTEAGQAVAMEDVCPHRSVPLSMGELVGDRVRCGYHGLEFAPDGKCARIPSQDHIPPIWRTKTYPVVERWRWIWIWMGDPALADESKIPDLYWNDHPDWIYTGGHFEIGCHYQLLVDNLLDLSHVAFVHRSTIGVDAVAEITPETKVEGQTVTVTRLMPNSPPPPLFSKLQSFPGNIDRSQTIECKPPANIVIASRAKPHGAPDDVGGRVAYQVVNGITPATEKSCHHFWSVPRNFAPGAEVTEMFHQGSVTAFSEDVDVLEAQQKMLDARGDRIKWLSFKVDVGGVAARRVVDALLKEEAAAAAKPAARLAGGL
jgi:phenylpropionate dioxygenase-like ring-hydroxylating dioxygenase large terminal subunit